MQIEDIEDRKYEFAEHEGHKEKHKSVLEQIIEEVGDMNGDSDVDREDIGIAIDRILGIEEPICRKPLHDGFTDPAVSPYYNQFRSYAF